MTVSLTIPVHQRYFPTRGFVQTHAKPWKFQMPAAMAGIYFCVECFHRVSSSPVPKAALRPCFWDYSANLQNKKKGKKPPLRLKKMP